MEKEKRIEDEIRRIWKKWWVRLLVYLLAALLSVFVVTPIVTSPKRNAHTLESLDAKKKDVQELTTAATGTAIAITLLPGDAATPIANKLADLSQYLLIVLCAIYLEKYLVTVMGLVTFRYLVPIAMGLLCIDLALKKHEIRSAALKISLLGIALTFVIPASVAITDMIETTYKASIESALENSEEVTKEISGGASTADLQKEESASTAATQDDQSLWDKIRGIPRAVTEGTTDVVSNLTQVSEEKLKELETVLNNFMESIAVMIITSCVIPILVLVFFIYVIKSVVSAATPVRIVLPESALGHLGHHRRREGREDR